MLNNIEIVTVWDTSISGAEFKANEFIHECNLKGVKILDIDQKFVNMLMANSLSEGKLPHYIFTFTVEKESAVQNEPHARK
jgi:hypothetical protein